MNRKNKMKYKGFMLLLIVTSILVLFVLSSYKVYASSVPGNRPDLSPGAISGFFNSHKDQILDIVEELPNIREEKENNINQLIQSHEKTIENMKKNKEEASSFTFFAKSKSDWEEEIKNEKEEHQKKIFETRQYYEEKYNQTFDKLKNLLSSPMTSDDEEYRNKTNPGELGREQAETYIAAKNLREVANKEIQVLVSNPSNYEQAVKTYDVLETLLTVTIKMNQELIQRIHQYYGPETKQKLLEIDRHKRKLRSDKDSSVYESELLRAEKFENIAKKIIKELPYLEKRAEERISVLQRKKSDINHLSRGANIGDGLESLASGVKVDLKKMEFETPPIPEYDVEDIHF